MSKILFLKNDRVGDLFNSLDGINAIITDNPNSKIEIIISQISQNLSFLFDVKNVKVSYLPYSLGIFDKIRLFLKLFNNSFDKIYILSPKNFYFYLPLFFNSKFYAITINNLKKTRPYNFLIKKLFIYRVNDRVNKKIKNSINFLIFNLCSTKPKLSYKNILNNKPICSILFNDNIDLFSNFIHIHYLHNVNTSDLFKLVSLSKTVVSPHGAMTVMASYLEKKVIDIFDINININSFREYKPCNENYNFFIIRPDFDKTLFKIKKFL